MKKLSHLFLLRNRELQWTSFFLILVPLLLLLLLLHPLLLGLVVF